MGEFIEDLVQPVEARLATDRSVGVSAVFSYSLSDPLAVMATFSVGDLKVTWTFARDLVRDGLVGRTGLGDVSVEPSGTDEVLVCLSSPEGEAALVCSRAPLADFIDRVYGVVPAGQESNWIDVEAWISGLTTQG